MIEYEINKAVADKLIQSGFIIGVEYHDKHILVMDKYANNYPFDPCNNAQQAWEIMLENDISITRIIWSDGYVAFHGVWSIDESFDPSHLVCSDNYINNPKPFVAAMLLFLEI